MDEGGAKTLSWASEFVEQSVHAEIEQSEKIKGFMTRKQILELNGVDFKEAQAAGIVEEMTKDLLDTFYKEAHVDPKDPALVQDSKYDQLKKFYYEFRAASKEIENSTHTRQLQVSTNAMKIDSCSKMLNDSFKAQVKIEHTSYIDLQNKVKAVLQGKSRLDKEITGLKDLLAELQSNSKLGDISKEFAKKLKVLEDFVSSIRSKHPVVTKIDSSDDSTCATALQEWTEMGDHMIIHIEGAKSMKTGMRALI